MSVHGVADEWRGEMRMERRSREEDNTMAASICRVGYNKVTLSFCIFFRSIRDLYCRFAGICEVGICNATLLSAEVMVISRCDAGTEAV